VYSNHLHGTKSNKSKGGPLGEFVAKNPISTKMVPLKK